MGDTQAPGICLCNGTMEFIPQSQQSQLLPYLMTGHKMLGLGVRSVMPLLLASTVGAQDHDHARVARLALKCNAFHRLRYLPLWAFPALTCRKQGAW